MRKFTAWFLRSVIRYRSDVVMANLSRCFPRMTYEELQETHKRFYLHLADIIAETFWFGRYTGEKCRKRIRKSHIVEFTNPEEFNRLYRGATQLMMLQAHTGNWELIGGILNYSYGDPLDIDANTIAVTYLKQRPEFVDRFLERNRTAAVVDYGFKGYVEASNVVRFAYKNKDNKYSYSFITDQFPYTSNLKCELNFMYRTDTATMTGAASLAVKFDMAVGYLRFRCREGGGYTLSIVPICDRAGGHDVKEIMQKYYDLLEEDLREQPWNYLWTHKRWK
ncbi:MAG: lysophospholipid acyltransferase family protein [Bacteroidales bacterium]|nr:lysophospholipid acyltransferase family protein [Bacteroidales bacterium]